MTELATAKLAINGGTPVRTRPFPGWPRHDEAERRGLLRALEGGAWGGRINRGDGEAAAFESEFAELHEAPAALAVTNGTHALQLALDLVGVAPGDEVLVPALTPIPTSNAVRQRGAVPVPVDVDPNTYGVDPDRLEAARTDRCTAVIVVHLGGHVADMDRILPWAARAGVAVIQDAAHAHGARWRDRGLGAFGTLATFSFMQSKVMTAGEGGALLLPGDAGDTDAGDTDAADTGAAVGYEQAFARHCLGRMPSGVPAGFQSASSNYRINEFAAAVLRAQLARLPEHNRHRELRRRQLAELVARVPGLTPQGRDPRCTTHPHYLAPMTLEPGSAGAISREVVVAALQAEGIPAYPMFPPIYRLPAFWDAPAHPSAPSVEHLAAACPAAEHIGRQGFFLRHEVLLGDERDIQDVAAAIQKVVGALTAEPSALRT
ncbi:MAG TPA: DegT/DnrJ/EryC1/StrS family aminotransferase [Streptosporangiaceae bacterium]|nr:DegT/DnrJ/EryC1/StrS family aminotransferase [Streptosporangiaceae bacterium]